MRGEERYNNRIQLRDIHSDIFVRGRGLSSLWLNLQFMADEMFVGNCLMFINNINMLVDLYLSFLMRWPEIPGCPFPHI